MLTLLIQNINFNFLLDHLETVYGPGHTVIHYIAAILPLSESTMEKYTITELRDPDTQNKITAISTFYLPPNTVLKSDQLIAAKMGIVQTTYSAVKGMEPEATARNVRDKLESVAIEQLESHVIPEGYKHLSASRAMVDVMTKLALDPKALAAYKQNPAQFIDSISGLTPLEAGALKLDSQGAIMRSMRGKAFPSTSSKHAS